MEENKEYLGDAVYVQKWCVKGILLTTEDGLKALDEIYLEAEVITALRAYLARHEL